MTSKQDFTQGQAGDLKYDVQRDNATEKLAQASADRAVQDNEHRKTLFTFVTWIVGCALGAVIVMMAALMIWKGRIETNVAIAFISALAIQSFVLIGLLARGLFPANSGKSSNSESVE
ncbi:hypothetical protein [Glutamicibacter ardleyensis]|uniref:hypothetical protein n=3 Tax=Glutamicibacter ardleyensis TaxID=225894 RepID=UPI003F9A38B1